MPKCNWLLLCRNYRIVSYEYLFSYSMAQMSNRQEGFCKKGILGNFAKITGKQFCQSLFFNKVTGLRLAILLKKRLWLWCFPVNFVKVLKTPFLKEHLWWLLLTYSHGAMFIHVWVSLTRNQIIRKRFQTWRADLLAISHYQRIHYHMITLSD